MHLGQFYFTIIFDLRLGYTPYTIWLTGHKVFMFLDYVENAVSFRLWLVVVDLNLTCLYFIFNSDIFSFFELSLFLPR